MPAKIDWTPRTDAVARALQDGPAGQTTLVRRTGLDKAVVRGAVRKLIGSRRLVIDESGAFPVYTLKT